MSSNVTAASSELTESLKRPFSAIISPSFSGEKSICVSFSVTVPPLSLEREAIDKRRIIPPTAQNESAKPRIFFKSTFLFIQTPPYALISLITIEIKLKSCANILYATVIISIKRYIPKTLPKSTSSALPPLYS